MGRKGRDDRRRWPRASPPSPARIGRGASNRSADRSACGMYALPDQHGQPAVAGEGLVLVEWQPPALAEQRQGVGERGRRRDGCARPARTARCGAKRYSAARGNRASGPPRPRIWRLYPTAPPRAQSRSGIIATSRSMALWARWRLVHSSGSIVIAASPIATQLRSHGSGRRPWRSAIGAPGSTPAEPRRMRSALASPRCADE